MKRVLAAVALALVAACGDQTAPTEMLGGPTLAKGPLVHTPSGAVFT